MSHKKQEFKIDDILKNYPQAESSLVMLLQDIQDRYNYLPRPALEEVAEHLGLTKAKIYGVATFYKAFSLEKRGKIIIKICKGTACHVRGAQQIQDEITRLLEIKPGQTTEDFKYTLEAVNCVGACAMAPVVMVGKKIYGEVKPSQMRKMLGIK